MMIREVRLDSYSHTSGAVYYQVTVNEAWREVMIDREGDEETIQAQIASYEKIVYLGPSMAMALQEQTYWQHMKDNPDSVTVLRRQKFQGLDLVVETVGAD